MALYLHCAICNRKQADGIISGMAWGRLVLPESAKAEHPGLNGSTLRVCPTCMERHPDWESSLLASLGLTNSSPSLPGG